MSETYLEMTHKSLAGRQAELLEAIKRNDEAKQQLYDEFGRMARELKTVETMMKAIEQGMSFEPTLSNVEAEHIDSGKLEKLAAEAFPYKGVGMEH